MIEFKQPADLRPDDPDNCVISTDPDGAYYRPNTGSMAGTYQILIIGPMIRTPGEYADALGALLGLPLVIRACAFLDCPEAHIRDQVLRRGFISILLDPRP